MDKEAQEKMEQVIYDTLTKNGFGIGSGKISNRAFITDIVGEALWKANYRKITDRPERRKEIVEAIDLLFKKENCGYSQYEMDVCVDQILALIPDQITGKPPLLSDEEVIEKMKEAGWGQNTIENRTPLDEREIQRESDIKFYEGCK